MIFANIRYTLGWGQVFCLGYDFSKSIGTGGKQEPGSIAERSGIWSISDECDLLRFCKASSNANLNILVHTNQTSESRHSTSNNTFSNTVLLLGIFPSTDLMMKNSYSVLFALRIVRIDDFRWDQLWKEEASPLIREIRASREKILPLKDHRYWSSFSEKNRSNNKWDLFSQRNTNCHDGNNLFGVVASQDGDIWLERMPLLPQPEWNLLYPSCRLRKWWFEMEVTELVRVSTT
jgi:hypothetical protein